MVPITVQFDDNVSITIGYGYMVRITIHDNLVDAITVRYAILVIITVQYEHNISITIRDKHVVSITIYDKLVDAIIVRHAIAVIVTVQYDYNISITIEYKHVDAVAIQYKHVDAVTVQYTVVVTVAVTDTVLHCLAHDVAISAHADSDAVVVDDCHRHRVTISYALRFELGVVQPVVLRLCIR